jgi:hypothetical protein
MTHSLWQLPRYLTRARIIGWSMGLFFVLALPACTAVKLGYQHAPDISYWWLDGYFDFNTSQSTPLRLDLSRIQAWHRQNELPTYIKTLEKMQRMAPSQVTPEQLCALYAEFKPRFQALIDQTEPLMVSMAPTLLPAQIVNLSRQLDKRSAKWRGEWVEGSLAVRQDRRAKPWLERTESLYGRLDETQLAALQAQLAETSFDATVGYKEQQRRHLDILQTFRNIQTNKPAVGAVKAEIRGLLERSMTSPDAAYRAQVEKTSQENCQTLATLHNSTTPAQRQKAVVVLNNYAADALHLMQKR